VLTEKLAQIYQLAGKPDQAIDAYESALRLAPSPEQRIQLRLALAQALLTEHFPEAARRDYQLLLQEVPDYPGRAAIEEKIKTLGETISASDAPAKK
jgi:tetratricopeptide (TPR) repeat protein